jgi:glutamate/tyrosine decarboxylase-like PLP-dependent enzyme
VEGLVSNAKSLARGAKDIVGAEVLNDVDYTQVCIRFGSDSRTREVTQRIIADGATWMSGSRWKDQDVLRISVSNWSTDDEDVRLSLEALSRAVAP